MRVYIEVFAGKDHAEPVLDDIQRNIEAQERAIEACPGDMPVLMDTLSILRGIAAQVRRIELPGEDGAR